MDERLERAAAILAERAHGRVERGASIAPYTSYRLGGPAGVLLEAAGNGDLEALSLALGETGAPFVVVGRGSNLLVSERGFPGIVVHLGAGFHWSRVDGETLEAGAAMPLPALAMLALQHSLAGFEFAIAIPASLGGAVRMNAGAHGREVADVLERATVHIAAGGRRAEVGAHEAGFDYRHSALPPSAIVIAARLALGRGEPERIRASMDEAKEWRRRTQPLTLPNGGSVFRNPPGDKAGRLIEAACGKGVRVGGARISEVHANFIVAERGASPNDVYTLIRRIQRTVRERMGVELEPELKLVGEFEEVPG